jgi:hypothetical protein
MAPGWRLPWLSGGLLSCRGVMKSFAHKGPAIAPVGAGKQRITIL